MKKLFGALALLLTCAQLFAQTNTRVRLALIAESDDAAPVVDLLTAQLSGDSKVQLLERDEIEKVYREQGLSAANRDDLKLGRILGADGLLLLNVSPLPGPANPNISSVSERKEVFAMRLIAVKPGVILASGSSLWSLKDITEWAQSARSYLAPFLPKLTVSVKDAIPISIVNLRSAIQSTDATATEHQLKLLTIQRLSQEPRFFVLERQKMQLLSEEKSLNSDESAFWNGKYLLEGTIDQNGYSRDTITINARLTPPRGSSPILFEVSSSRTNLAEVVNALTAKVAESLNVNSSVKGWNAPDEASQFLDEAKWALKWGSYEEAQAAAESAWALGKKDLDCALVRVKAYTSDVSAHVEKYQTLLSTYGPTYDLHSHPVIPAPKEAVIQADIASMAARHPCVMVYHEYRSGDGTVVDYAYSDTPPDPENIDKALYALELYNEFSRNSSQAVMKAASVDSRWKNSEWYDTGIQDLAAASQVLQNFNLASSAGEKFSDKLADLRAQTRSVAEWISAAPPIRDGYFVGDRIATRDELIHTIEENPNIFRCEVNWGCFWQERPEDAIALYRELMSSPVFCYIHSDFWNRKPIQPRLIAWNEGDQKNIPAIWDNFASELDNSTNVLWSMEAKALAKADATNGEEAKAAEDNWWNIVRSHREELVGNNVELFYLGWGFAYNSETEAMDEDYWQKTIPALHTSFDFEKQKQYLANFTPYDFQTFLNVFSSKNYSKAQAAELLPFIVAYESNMVATASPQKLFFAKSDAQWIGMILEKPIHEILNPPAPPNVAAARNAPTPSQAGFTRPTSVEQKTALPDEVPTNILQVVNFIKIPSGQIQSNDISGGQIFAQRWSDGKLLFGVAYNRQIYSFDKQGNWLSTREASLSAIAIFNPVNQNWDFVNCPETANFSAITYSMQGGDNRIILFQGNLFSSTDGPLKKFDFQKRQWSDVEIPEQDGCDLFSVAGHLYAINQNVIFELAKDGSTRILASTRRRPAVTALDSLESFGSRPSNRQLFAGADQSLCAIIEHKIYRWDGNDWHEILAMNNSEPPEIFEDGLIFRNIPYIGDGDSPTLWFWDMRKPQPELCLADPPKPHPGIIGSSFRKPPQVFHPPWNSLSHDYLTYASVAFYDSNLYFFVDHADVTNDNNHLQAMEKDGYHAKLVCLSRNCPDPLVVPLKFDTRLGQPPLKILGKRIKPWLQFDSSALNTTMYFFGGTLYLTEDSYPGIWTIPLTELKSIFAAQKQIPINH